MDSKVIVLFNHKGGVSKTTTTYHVGWKLTEYGKKVLLVDGDPQCNLTSLLLGEYFDEYYTNSQTSKNNIKDAVNWPLKESHGLFVQLIVFLQRITPIFLLFRDIWIYLSMILP